jgi:hypothetical protein
MREIFLYCDESIGSGKYYSNFYGGIAVDGRHIKEVNDRLVEKKAALNFYGELKWQKISEAYADKYIQFIDEIFLLMSEGKVKVRIMFRHNIWIASGLTREQVENEYFMLYYQFIKHAFGLQYVTEDRTGANVRLHFDRLPDTREKVAAFKGHLLGLNRSAHFLANRVRIREDQIAEIDSKEHAVLQALDVILGSIQFYLNDKHKEMPAGEVRRGKRTIAKERVYRFINQKIRGLVPNFNIGVSTSSQGAAENKWLQPYRHWSFKPNGYEKNPNYKKKSSATAR